MATRRPIGASFIWTSASKGANQVLLVITMAWLARLLRPEAIGLMSLCLLYIQFFDNFVDAGFLQAIVQAPRLDPKLLNGCFAFLAGMAVLFYAVTWPGAWGFAVFFAEPSLARLIRTAALILFCMPFHIIAVGLLTRQLRMDLVGKFEILAGLIRSTVSILLAWHGFGVWSLVYGYLFYRLFIALAAFSVCNWKPGFAFDFHAVRPILDFGIKITAGRILWYFHQRIDYLMIGRFLGAEVLGIYSIGKQIFDQLLMLFSLLYNRILYPLTASYYHEGKDYQRLLVNAVKLFSLVVFPISFFMAASADEIVQVAFGAQWADSAMVLAAFGWIGGFRIINPLLLVAVNAIGWPGYNIGTNLVLLVVLSMALYLGVLKGDLPGVLLSYGLVFPPLFFALQYTAARKIGIPFIRFLKAVMPSILFSLALFAGIQSLGPYLGRIPPLLNLLILAAICVCLFWISLLSIFKKEYRMLSHLIQAR